MSDGIAREELDDMPDEPSDDGLTAVPGPEEPAPERAEETPPPSEPLFEIAPTEAPAVAEAATSDEGRPAFEPVFEFAAETPEAPGEAPASAPEEAFAATQVLPAVEPPAPAPSAAPDFFSAAGPREIEQPPAPRRMRVPWLRILVLPRSTFARLAEVRRAWPAAFTLFALAAIARGGLAVAFSLQKPLGLRMTAVLGIRYGLGLLGPILFVLAAAWLMRLAQRWWQGDAPYGRLVSAFSLTLVPLALRNLVQAAYVGVTRTVLLHPGLSALVAPPTRSPLRTAAYAGLSTLDLFAVWTFVLLVMAAAVTRGRGRAKGVVVAFLLALVGAAAAAGASVGVSILLAR